MLLSTEKFLFFHCAGFGIFGRHKILCVRIRAEISVIPFGGFCRHTTIYPDRLGCPPVPSKSCCIEFPWLCW